MKKIICMLLIVVSVLSFASCKKDSKNEYDNQAIDFSNH